MYSGVKKQRYVFSDTTLGQFLTRALRSVQHPEMGPSGEEAKYGMWLLIPPMELSFPCVHVLSLQAESKALG